MNFTEAFKVFELNILRQSGVTVTPQQLGLKSDPIADLQAKSALSQNGSFGNILGKLGANSLQGLTPPTPPTPPADPTDTAAQAKYQQDLLTYQNSFQVYNQHFMQLMLMQFQQLQQSIAAGQQQQNKSSSPEAGIGTGGILTGSDV